MPTLGPLGEAQSGRPEGGRCGRPWEPWERSPDFHQALGQRAVSSVLAYGPEANDLATGTGTGSGSEAQEEAGASYFAAANGSTAEGEGHGQGSGNGNANGGGDEEKPLAQQYVRFTFYRLDPAWRRLPAEERARQRAQMAAVVERAQAEGALLESYSVTGTRGDSDFMLWHASPRLEDMYDMAGALNHCALSGYLSIAHNYLSVTKRSQYVGGHRHPDQPDSRLEVRMGEGKYLVVYPFVKTRPWYKLTHGARQGMMVEHIRVGHKYPQIRIHTTYSYGLDDQEFTLAFDADEPFDFVDLMMELRASEASAYTLTDTPSFTCRHMPIAEALDLLG